MSVHRPGWLVVNADDLGVSRGSTLGIIKAHREGIVTSASLAATTPHYQFAVESVRQCPALGIGLHFTLTSGKPVADARRVPWLVNEAGFFRWRFSSLLVAAIAGRPAGLMDQIDLELDAQFERLKRDGIQPDHVDGERHVHLIPGILERVVAAARRYGVPYVRAAQDLGPSLLKGQDVPALALGGGFVKWGVLRGLTSRAGGLLGGVSSADRIASYLYTGRTASFIPMLLSSAPQAGVTELMVHPAMPVEDRELSLGNPELERYVTSADRLAELDACLSARGKTGSWQLTTFRQLAAVTAGRSA